MTSSLAAFLAAVLLASPVQAADAAAGKAKVESVCAACHGVDGVSVSDAIPNLAAQKAPYIEAQLKALREGTRKNAIMAAIAAQLTDAEIADVGAYFSSRPGAAAGARSPLMPALAASHAAFPENFPGAWRRYHAVNLPAEGRVQHFLANDIALAAAREGRPLPDGAALLSVTYAARLDGERKPVSAADGFYEPAQLLGLGEMVRGPNWGATIPAMLRNGDWNYGVFNADGRMLPANQAECLACHKPQAAASYVFTLERLREAARVR